METSILPQDWRDANVKPIFKSGDKTQCENYRPISLTCIAVKVFEKILLMKIERFVEENKLIHNSQYGFRRNKSCESQLLQYTHYLCKNFDKKIPVHSVYLDLQKAFDKVPHAELLYKLENFIGIKGELLLWLRAFLTNRRQRVCIGRSYSINGLQLRAVSPKVRC